jgi:hypothetical protein
LDERIFAFNNRGSGELRRMVAVTSAVTGRRLTYVELIAD